jgi:hypothetical protein
VNPSYVRIRVGKDEALRRFAVWRGLAEVGPLVRATASLAPDLACDAEGAWKGRAVFVSEVDLSGELGDVPATSWLALASKDDLVFAG